MSEKEKKTKQPIWLYAILGLLAIALVVLLVHISSLKNDKEALEAEKELQRQDFQAEVDSLMKAHNELKENYGELSQQLAEKDWAQAISWSHCSSVSPASMWLRVMPYLIRP